MTNSFNQQKQKQWASIFTILAIVFFAANLRAPITSVGPVIGEISKDLSLSKTTAGLITTIPLLAFGFLSSLIPKISKKYGMELVLLLSLLLLGLGLGMRSYGSLFTLLLGSAFVGTAITFGNVLMPAFIKLKFPYKIGFVMGMYSVGMNLTAALAAGFSVSIGKWTKLGWQASLGIWIILVFIGFFLWFPQIPKKKHRNNKKNIEENHTTPLSSKTLLKSPLAWSVTIFMGLQSLLFYCISAWLPKVAQDWGMGIEASGWLLSYMQFAQLPTTFIGSLIASRLKDQRILSILTAFLFIFSLIGILLFKTQYIVLFCIILGIGSGLAFSLAMLFFILRTKNIHHSSQLSGMAQSIGYLLAAIGPPLFGAIYDWKANWNISFLFLIGASIILLFVGVIAGKNNYIRN